MDTRKVMIGMSVAAAASVGAAAVLARRRGEPFDVGHALPHFSGVIAEVLHEHEGEESPIPHAFEDAFQEEEELERQLARETDVRY